MRKIMVRVNEQSFRNLSNLNLDSFYNNLSDSDKKKITSNDMVASAELLKKTNEYKHLEQALKILVKCNSNLYDTIVKERTQLENNISQLQNKKKELQESKMNLVTLYNTSNLIQQVSTLLKSHILTLCLEIHQTECHHSP
jgi:uncharacterized protein (DUF3084 family)